MVTVDVDCRIGIVSFGRGYVPPAPFANYGPALLLLALTNLDQAIFGSNDIFWLGGRCNFSWLIAETLTG